MVSLVLQEIDLLSPLFVLSQLLVLDLLLQGLFFLFHFLGPFFQMRLFFLKLSDGEAELRSTLLGLELLPHREGERILIKSLICIDRQI